MAMRGRVARDLEWSNRAVVELVWPHVSATLGGSLIPADQEWDTDAGVDFMWARGLRRDTLATRVQKVDYPYSTFTIRSRTSYGNATEWQKRQTAVAFDGLRPSYTLQAYVSKDLARMLSAALVYSDDLYRIAFDPNYLRPEYRNQDGSRFRAVPWSAFATDRIWTWTT